MLCAPRAKPDLKPFSKFRKDLNLTDECCILLNPFEYSAPTENSKNSSFVAMNNWTRLQNICEERYIVGPVIGTSHTNAIIPP